MIAFAFRSGVIEFGRRCPSGALAVGSGPASLLREIVVAIARHAYDGKTLLVPGVPEAPTSSAALIAADDFRKRIETQLQRRQIGDA